MRMPVSHERVRSDEVFLNSLDRALNIVGDAAKQVVYEALENRYHVTREQIPSKPEQLVKVLNLYLGSAAVAVQKESLLWIKETSGIEANDLREALDALRAADEASENREETIQSSASQGDWKLESQSNVPEIESTEESNSYKYFAKFSFGPTTRKKREGEDSREALEAYLKSIVERHTKNKEESQDL